MYRNQRIAVIVPAYNEAPAIGAVVDDLYALTAGPSDEAVVDCVIVADNGSSDATAAVAEDHGAQVVHEPRKGYGAACLAGIAALPEVDVVAFVDGDCSVDCTELPMLLDALARGADLVVGSRALGRQHAGSMTSIQHHGNRLAAWLMTRFWGRPVTDLGPFRAITRRALVELAMQDKAFGWTVEMQIKALQRGLNIAEVAVTNRRRVGRSKVSGTVRGTIGAARAILGMIVARGIADRVRRAIGTVPQRSPNEHRVHDAHSLHQPVPVRTRPPR